MDFVLAWLLRQMRRARLVFTGLYLVVSAGYLYAAPRAHWTWFIVVAGALLCLLFWWLVGFRGERVARGRQSDDAGGTGNG